MRLKSDLIGLDFDITFQTQKFHHQLLIKSITCERYNERPWYGNLYWTFKASYTNTTYLLLFYCYYSKTMTGENKTWPEHKNVRLYNDADDRYAL